MTTTTRTDLYTRVTDRIIADLEQGVRPWLKPWHSRDAEGRVTLPLRHNGTPYRGVNILLLWGEAMTKGYTNPIWMTYKQAAELNAQVRKGEHGSLVVYADRIRRTETKDNGEDVEREIPFLKGYTVFNAEQIESLPDHYYAKPQPKGEPLQLQEGAERFFASTGATFRHSGNVAYYAPGPDLIQLPPPEAFRDAESYAAIKAHELTHWTKHESRLNREFGRKRFGDTAYAREELVAELGAAFLCASLGITLEPREDHAAYLAHWLRVMREDKRALFSATAYAQRAVDYLHNLQVKTGAGSLTGTRLRGEVHRSALADTVSDRSTLPTPRASVHCLEGCVSKQDLSPPSGRWNQKYGRAGKQVDADCAAAATMEIHATRSPTSANLA